MRPALLSKAPYIPYFRYSAARTRASRLEALTQSEQSSKSGFPIWTYRPQASTMLPHCTYRSIQYVQKVAECDTHRTMAVVAAMPGRLVSGSGCTAPQNSVCDHTQGFIPFSCHRGIQSAHHRAFQALEAQVRCLLMLQVSIKAHMTETRTLQRVYGPPRCALPPYLFPQDERDETLLLSRAR